MKGLKKMKYLEKVNTRLSDIKLPAWLEKANRKMREVVNEVKHWLHSWLQNSKRYWRWKKRQFKAKLIRRRIAYEREKGLSVRCEWCPENIFCSAYMNHITKKGEIPRCDSVNASGR